MLEFSRGSARIMARSQTLLPCTGWHCGCNQVTPLQASRLDINTRRHTATCLDPEDKTALLPSPKTGWRT